MNSLFFTLVVFTTLFGSIISGLPKQSPFDSALETLQNQIGYKFKNVELLRRAMTHSSFSEENNKALSILGANLISTSVSMHYLAGNIDISPKELNRHVAELSNVETSCAVDGKKLGIHKVVRVSPKTDASSFSVVCGAFRAVFGAINMDSESCDKAADLFWSVHGSGKMGKAVV